MTDLIIIGAIFIIAILYSSVGHGGASGYLALMALMGFAPEIMRPAALTLNLFVAAIAFVSFYRNGHFKFKLLWPFIVSSVPMAFLGGMIEVDEKVYKITLGIFLLLAIARMLFQSSSKTENYRKANIPLSLVIGAVLGFFSGLIGIGGGIILSPIIILLGWANMKQTAAVSAVFIWVNSLAGLTGFLTGNTFPDMGITQLVVAGVLGGLVGSYLGSFRLNDKILRYLLAFVLFFASVKLFIF